MRGLIVDYFGVLDGTDEDRENWRAILAGARENDVRVAVLSNEPEGPGADRVREDAAQLGIEQVVLSGATGVEKPEAEAFLEAARRLDQPVGERRFAVVDMGDNREVADMVELGHRPAR